MICDKCHSSGAGPWVELCERHEAMDQYVTGLLWKLTGLGVVDKPDVPNHSCSRCGVKTKVLFFTMMGSVDGGGCWECFSGKAGTTSPIK